MQSKNIEDVLVQCDPDSLRRGLKTLLENLPGAAYRCLKDEHWSMIWLSASVEEMTGYAADTFTSEEGGVTYEELILPEDRARVRSYIEAAIHRDEIFQVIYRVKTHTDEVRWFWEQGQRVDLQVDGCDVLEGYITDVTHVRALEERTRRTHRLEMLGLMVGSLLHDLGNLMMPITSCLEMLDDEEQLSAPTRKSVVEATLASERMTNLVSQIRRFVKDPEAGAGSCLPDAVIGRFRSVLKRLITPRHTLRFELNAPAVRVTMPEGDLELVLLNLVVNAVEANPDGCEVVVSTQCVVEDGLQVIHLGVADSGEGIAPEHMERIFEPLYTTKLGGTGLGLANTYRLVTSARGQIKVTSQPGDTRFTVRVPALQVKERRPLVLLVEPNHVLCQLAARQLRAQDNRVLVASTARRAVELMEDSPRLSALVLGDISERDTLAALAREREPRVSVIFLRELFTES